MDAEIRWAPYDEQRRLVNKPITAQLHALEQALFAHEGRQVCLC
jgi:hypothetical protein